MKLYYSPGACSLTQHILLRFADLDFTIEKVDLKSKKTDHNHDFLKVNPRGQVPILVLNDGTVLTENIAIAQYIADKSPNVQLLAPVNSLERYQTLSWLSYVATDLHKAYSPLFRSQVEAEKDAAIKALNEKFVYLNKQLTGREFICTDYFTIADAYLYVVLRWRKIIPNLPVYPAIDAFIQRIDQLPAVQEALQAER